MIYTYTSPDGTITVDADEAYGIAHPEWEKKEKVWQYGDIIFANQDEYLNHVNSLSDETEN